jgi:hypothetical protein
VKVTPFSTHYWPSIRGSVQPDALLSTGLVNGRRSKLSLSLLSTGLLFWEAYTACPVLGIVGERGSCRAEPRWSGSDLYVVSQLDNTPEAFAGNGF